MRPLPWTGAMLAMLFVSPPHHGLESPGPSARSAAPIRELDVAVEWIGAQEPATENGVFRGGYRVSNRGGAESGPLQLRVRTPLGLVTLRKLTTSLSAGETLAGTVDVQVVPGLSELCIDVCAFDGERMLPDADPSNNRVCRRLPDRPGDARSSPASRRPEDVP